MDPDVQAQVEQIYSDRTNLDYTSSSGQQLQSAITVIDNETGNLVGIAGRVGEKTGNLWMNFATDSQASARLLHQASVGVRPRL